MKSVRGKTNINEIFSFEVDAQLLAQAVTRATSPWLRLLLCSHKKKGPPGLGYSHMWIQIKNFLTIKCRRWEEFYCFLRGRFFLLCGSRRSERKPFGETRRRSDRRTCSSAIWSPVLPTERFYLFLKKNLGASVNLKVFKLFFDVNIEIYVYKRMVLSKFSDTRPCKKIFFIYPVFKPDNFFIKIKNLTMPPFRKIAFASGAYAITLHF